MALPIYQNPSDDAADLKLVMKVRRLARIARMAANSTIDSKRVRLEMEPDTKRLTPRITEDPEPTPVGNEVIIFRELLGAFIGPQDLPQERS